MGILTASTALLLCFAAAEVLLRAAGRGPWREIPFGNEPRMNEPDPDMGWRPVPGHYVFSGPAPGADAIEITILPGGMRTVGAVPEGGGRRVAFVGGSMTHGSAISDAETFSWKLQQRNPDLRIANHGVVGYGTYQSLQRMERLFDDPETAPEVVVYGFFGHHERRNVADGVWLEGLSKNARRGHVFLPYATLGDDASLVRHPPERHPQWPGSRQLATLHFGQTLLARARARGREAQARSVTRRLLIEMDDFARRQDASFLVAFLQLRKDVRVAYEDFLRRRGIRFVDCAVAPTPDLRVPGDEHPNGKLNTLWSHCLERAIRRLMAQRDG